MWTFLWTNQFDAMLKLIFKISLAVAAVIGRDTHVQAVKSRTYPRSETRSEAPNAMLKMNPKTALS
jgi:hypothetical protein